MRAIVFLVTCLAILITTACGDKAVTPYQPSETETQIIGNWLWQESCGGIAGICTDSSAFGSEGISFTKDGVSFGWCPVCDPLYSDYKIVQKKSYTYGSDTIVTAIERKYENDVLVDFIIKQLDDTGLTLIEDCGDCYVTTYSRIRATEPVIVIPDSLSP